MFIYQEDFICFIVLFTKLFIKWVIRFSHFCLELKWGYQTNFQNVSIINRLLKINVLQNLQEKSEATIGFRVCIWQCRPTSTTSTDGNTHCNDERWPNTVTAHCIRGGFFRPSKACCYHRKQSNNMSISEVNADTQIQNCQSGTDCKLKYPGYSNIISLNQIVTQEY